MAKKSWYASFDHSFVYMIENFDRQKRRLKAQMRKIPVPAEVGANVDQRMALWLSRVCPTTTGALTLPWGMTQWLSQPFSVMNGHDGQVWGVEVDCGRQPLALCAKADHDLPLQLQRRLKLGAVEPIEMARCRTFDGLFEKKDGLLLWVEPEHWCLTAFVQSEPVLCRSKPRRGDEDWSQELDQSKTWLEQQGLSWDLSLFIAGPDALALDDLGSAVCWEDLWDFSGDVDHDQMWAGVVGLALGGW